jgi:hypothetical protein
MERKERERETVFGCRVLALIVQFHCKRRSRGCSMERKKKTERGERERERPLEEREEGIRV